MGKLLSLLILLFTLLFACKSRHGKAGEWLVIKPNAHADNSLVVFVPENIEECYTQIDKVWRKTRKAGVMKMSQEDFADSEFGTLGMYMRNNWGLWRGSKLSRYFNKYDIHNAETYHE